MLRTRVFVAIFLSLCTAQAVIAADDDPIHQRHELMEDVGGAAKPLGEMLKGERDFDAVIVTDSFTTMQEVAAVFGDLFPEGTYEGGEEKARETVWTDRDGFNQQLAAWSEALDAAIAAQPQDLAAFQPVASDVFKTCKSCHEDYRIPGD